MRSMKKWLFLIGTGSLLFGGGFWSCAGSNNLIMSLDMFAGIITGALLSGVF